MTSKRATGRKRIVSKKGRARDNSTVVPAGVQRTLAELMPHLEKCIPETTACALIGLDWNVWDGYCTRYPALRLAVKRAQAERLVEWQKTVEAGAQGWQAAATLLERRDPGNWSRNASTASKPKLSPLARALGGRGRK